MPVRKFIPILIVNVLVVLTVTMVIVRNPSHARAAALVMPVLFVANYLFIRKIQRKHAEAVASGTAAPQSPARRRRGMWALGLLGALCYVSGAFNLPMLLSQHDLGPWLGWSVKMVFGTYCIWAAWRIHGSLKANNLDSHQLR